MAKEAPKPSKNKIPAWMTSFSDMMTNMLCFFILMVALATQQEIGFVDSGIGSHFERLEALGLPGIMPSSRTLIPKGSPLAQYKPPKIDPLAKENWVEHTEKMLNEEFDRLKNGEASALDDGKPFPVPLGIKFSSGSSRLTLQDRRNLDSLAPTLASRPGSLEVQGFCGETEAVSFRSRLDLSLQRALEVIRYLESGGVPLDRMRAIGSGVARTAQGDPIANRRVLLVWRISE